MNELVAVIRRNLSRPAERQAFRQPTSNRRYSDSAFRQISQMILPVRAKQNMIEELEWSLLPF